MIKSVLNYFGTMGQDFVFRMRNRGLDTWSVYIDQDELKLHKNGRLNNSLRLSDLESISAINRDKFTWDEIFLIFSGRGKHVWVSQFAEGFDQISIEIARLFPIRNKDWNIELNGVAAFEERQILLWER